MIVKHLIFAAGLSAMVSCASAGFLVEAPIAAQIHPGLTSQTDAIRLCGNPNSTDIDEKGNTTYIWSYAHYSTFSGRMDIVRLNLVFDSGGKLITKKYASSLHY